MSEKADKSDIPEKFLKPYSPQDEEEALYKLWEDSGYFNPDKCIEDGIAATDAETFSIVLPPPNVTGTLHMGHAAMLAVEDILVRYNRMRGKRTLWIPGTDSAAVATQAKVEKDLYKRDKKTRYDIGREALMDHIINFSKESESTILNQVRRMGSSLDWSRYAFTLDEKRYHAVMTAFVRMYETDLIYRGARIVNWDPNMQTTISDDEVEYVEQTDPFYYLKYGPFTIGTVRPETKFGDKYVVMHPDDKRYKKYEHGEQLEVEWINGPITATIIKDEAADPEVGSGVMTITPAHSTIDFEIAERHDLDKEQVIDERGILLPIAGEFKGEHIKKARAKIVEKLEKKGLIEKVDENYTHNVATNSRGGGVIEPQIKKQWFIDVNKEFTMGPSGIPGIKEGQTVSLKTLMRTAVEKGGITIFPDRFAKVYYHWINNLRDWCISRQIWYGHRIPVWYQLDKEMYKTYQKDPDAYTETLRSLEQQPIASIEKPEGEYWVQDPDTLDTWFSSGLWTFSTLGWPEETDDLKTYHPTTLLETGYDILFFWIARMVLMTTFLRGEVPFQNVYLHGLVRDEKGQKMSKSLGNIIDPLDMVEKFGADATRLSLIVGAAPGNDVPLSEDKIRGYKHFANKIWNISRFVIENTDSVDFNAPYSEYDKKIWNRFELHVKDVTEDIEGYRLYLAAEKAYHYMWHEFADKILEHSKTIFAGESPEESGPEFVSSRKKLLASILVDGLKLLHPFMPYVTEAIWQEMPEKLKENERELLMITSWPIQK